MRIRWVNPPTSGGGGVLRVNPPEPKGSHPRRGQLLRRLLPCATTSNRHCRRPRVNHPDASSEGLPSAFLSQTPSAGAGASRVACTRAPSCPRAGAPCVRARACPRACACLRMRDSRPRLYRSLSVSGSVSLSLCEYELSLSSLCLSPSLCRPYEKRGPPISRSQFGLACSQMRWWRLTCGRVAGAKHCAVWRRL
jgi:hypothetical protein